ncbi:hypothetical protein BH18ACT15_BH18ACT15_13080 [soil metagenome]
MTVSEGDGAIVVVLRCRDCGDVFPFEGTDEAECPSCGGRRLHVAGEPLL